MNKRFLRAILYQPLKEWVDLIAQWAEAGLIMKRKFTAFLAVDRHSHSASNTLYGLFVLGLHLSASGLGGQ